MEYDGLHDQKVVRGEIAQLCATIPEALPDNPGVSSSVDGPWFTLWCALCHQGDVYSASFAAVPHIIQTLSGNLDKACFDFFLLPASIEVARHKRETPVPESLRAAYQQSLERLPCLVSGVATRPWDSTFCRSVLAAAAVGKSQYATAELLLEIDDSDTRETLTWYLSR
jgi:hypothetical protein